MKNLTGFKNSTLRGLLEASQIEEDKDFTNISYKQYMYISGSKCSEYRMEADKNIKGTFVLCAKTYHY